MGAGVLVALLMKLEVKPTRSYLPSSMFLALDIRGMLNG